jgi:hypothetical protein
MLPAIYYAWPAAILKTYTASRRFSSGILDDGKSPKNKETVSVNFKPPS